MSKSQTNPLPANPLSEKELNSLKDENTTNGLLIKAATAGFGIIRIALATQKITELAEKAKSGQFNREDAHQLGQLTDQIIKSFEALYFLNYGEKINLHHLNLTEKDTFYDLFVIYKAACSLKEIKDTGQQLVGEISKLDMFSPLQSSIGKQIKTLTTIAKQAENAQLSSMIHSADQSAIGNLLKVKNYLSVFRILKLGTELTIQISHVLPAVPVIGKLLNLIPMIESQPWSADTLEQRLVAFDTLDSLFSNLMGSDSSSSELEKYVIDGLITLASTGFDKIIQPMATLGISSVVNATSDSPIRQWSDLLVGTLLQNISEKIISKELKNEIQSHLTNSIRLLAGEALQVAIRSILSKENIHFAVGQTKEISIKKMREVLEKEENLKIIREALQKAVRDGLFNPEELYQFPENNPSKSQDARSGTGFLVGFSVGLAANKLLQNLKPKAATESKNVKITQDDNDYLHSDNTRLPAKPAYHPTKEQQEAWEELRQQALLARKEIEANEKLLLTQIHSAKTRDELNPLKKEVDLLRTKLDKYHAKFNSCPSYQARLVFRNNQGLNIGEKIKNSLEQALLEAPYLFDIRNKYETLKTASPEKQLEYFEANMKNEIDYVKRNNGWFFGDKDYDKVKFYALKNALESYKKEIKARIPTPDESLNFLGKVKNILWSNKKSTPSANDSKIKENENHNDHDPNPKGKTP